MIHDLFGFKLRAVAQDIQLDWPSRTWQAGADLPKPRENRPIERADDDRVTLYYGDALETAAAIAHENRERVHLVYVDPPYASQADYVAEARLDGVADGRTRKTVAYSDRWRGPDGVGAYLDMLAPRLDAAARLLRDDGTMWVHLDWRSAYLVRVVLDEIFGRDAFLNEIVWRRAPNLGRQAASAQFGRTLDTILVYGKPNAKITPPTRLEPIEARAVRFDDEGRPFTTAPRGDYTDASIEKLEKEGRVHRTSSGRVYIKYFLVKKDGEHYRERRVDALWTDVAPLRHAKTSERTGYPTQKPLSLLDRIVRCASPEGGLVVDLFSGSGTTALAAAMAGRRAIASDKSPIAIATARSRLMREGIAPTIIGLGEDLPRAQARAALDWHKDGVRVILHEPSMPLAWAVDASGGKGAFRATWHAERTLGTAPAQLPTFVDVKAKGTIRVRAWGDDGTLHEATLDVSSPK
jgi:DNA modification methylase